MIRDEKEKIVLLILIAGRKQKDPLLSAMSCIGVCLKNTIYGKGTVKASYVQNVLGLVPEVNKVVLTCVLHKSKADIVLKMVLEEFEFNKPNTGVAFTIPIDRVSF